MPVMRLLADGGDQLVAELRQLLGDEEGIAASAHVKHPVFVEVEFCLEAVVAAQDLHREPRRHDLGDGSRSEGLIGVLGNQLVALLVNHEHDPRWSHACDLLLDAGERRGGQEQGEVTARASRRDHMATPGDPTYRLRAETGKPPSSVVWAEVRLRSLPQAPNLAYHRSIPSV